MCDEREPYVTRRGERGDAQRDASGGVVRVRPASPSLAQFKGVRSGERRGETRRHALLQSSPEVILLALLLDARRLSLREALLVERLRDARGWGSARHGHGSKPIHLRSSPLEQSDATSKSVRAFRATRRAGAAHATVTGAGAPTRTLERASKETVGPRDVPWLASLERRRGGSGRRGVFGTVARARGHAGAANGQIVHQFSLFEKLQLFLLTSPRGLLASSSRTSLSANVPKREPFCETNISRITTRRPSLPRPLFACATNSRAGPGRPPRAAIACPPRRARDKLAIQTRPIRPTRSPATCA